MSWGIVASVGGAVIGGAMSSSASKSAARDQAAAADRATEAERQAMERQIELQEPWRQAGGLGLNRLAYELGLSPTGTFNAQTGNAGSMMETEQQIRDRLTPQFINRTPVAPTLVNTAAGEGGIAGNQPGPLTPQTFESTLEEKALATAVQAELRKQRALQAAQDAAAGKAAQKDPAYGNLLRDFTMRDFQQDPGAEFRREEGERGMTRAAAASGLLGSGRYLKDAMRFNSGLASQEYGAAFDRFNVNKTNRYNRLASISGVGQTAANQTGAAVGAFGNAAANNAIGAGNAAAAGRVGSANAWNNAIGQGVSAYQTNALLNRAPAYGAPQNPFYTG